MARSITVYVHVHAPLHIVWHYWTEPEHIKNWNAASDDWHTASAVNDLDVGGSFNYRMEAKDASEGFNFEGKYDNILPNELIEFTMSDGRHVKVTFEEKDVDTTITETFDAEDSNSVEMQREGWQAILDRFKYYVEINEK